MEDFRPIRELVHAAKEFVDLLKVLEIPGLKATDKKKLDKELKLADELIKAGKLDAALAKYEEISKIFPKSGRPVLGQIWIYSEQDKYIKALSLSGLAIKLEEGNKIRVARAKMFIGQVQFALFERYNGKQEINECISTLEEAREDDPENLSILANLAQACAVAKYRCNRARKEDANAWQNKSNIYFDEIIVSYRKRPANNFDVLAIDSFISTCTDYQDILSDPEFSSRFSVLNAIQSEKVKLLKGTDSAQEYIKKDKLDIKKLTIRLASVIVILSTLVGFKYIYSTPINTSVTLPAPPPIHKVQSSSFDDRQTAAWQIGLQLVSERNLNENDNFIINRIHKPEHAIQVARLSKPGSSEITS